ncbi:ATP-binding protein [Streptomyces luteolus]|uniref:ATP-binding protein n=1 Tax=Streptomyces luteolus TaxID=3043615 RepID=A0ABT6STN6_9ACTN|nr:ATP-binding protein [Streptomyces sp. B-S-A12]MDI3418711.1 ATP-binding protein [Streptomyces sp. B-S-A12]
MNADIDHADASHPESAQLATPAHQFVILLSATPRGARLARRLAAGQLHSWGWPYETEANHTATLLVAELAANAAVHGRVRGRDFRLRLTASPGDPVLRIEVTDARPDRRPPAPGTLPPPFPDLESGRGLLLVEALSTGWGTSGDTYTKTVWCEVALA